MSQTAHADFVHLRVHTAYSLAEGAIKVKELAGLCQEHNMPAVGITDSGNLFGALEFGITASASGVQPIVGAQLNIRRGEKETKGALSVVGGTAHVTPAPDHLLFLAQNEAGYKNLMDLVSKAFLDGDPGETPQIALSDVESRNEGLICLTGAMGGGLARLLLEGQRPAAIDLLDRLQGLFPGRLYIELQRHGLSDERRVENDLVDLAFERDIPLVATNECFFAAKGFFEAHDALLCIAGGTTVSQSDRRHVSDQHYFKSAAEMRELFADLPEAVDNTLVIAKRCAFIPPRLDPILPPFATEGGRDEPAELAAQAKEGLEHRLLTNVFTDDMDEAKREEIAKPYRDRIEMELGVITGMGFPGYFLIVADFIQWAKSHDIPVGPGRGSGAGSVVAWSLLITDLDPLRWGLLFERFLNPERVSMPDFDIDFCQDRRDEVISYVQDKYGHDKVAQIITFGKLQARAALRDVGRVLEMPYGQVDRICKLVPNNPAAPVTLSQAIESEQELRNQRDQDENVAHLLKVSMQLEGLYRHASTHAAGVVIGDRPLHELVPLYRDPRSDMPVTQFNMKWVEQAGLVKFDFLGLKTLSVLKKAVGMLKDRDIELDLENLPLDDASTYEMLSKGDSTGVFQLESSGMRDVLRQLKPDRFEDIIALVALYRPGPMANIPKYIACKHGTEQPDYMHPNLKPILTETFGIMIYQEQVQQAAQLLAGYTLGGADLLRRAMGKKIKEEMDAQRETFVKGSIDNDVDGKKASEIFDQIAAFAGYGFNKSHAAAYALVAYQTAYLKANYPVEFLAASMSYDMGNTDKLNVFRQELQRLGIPLLGPDVNKSFPEFAVEKVEDDKWGIRYALAAIKNVGEQAMEALCENRNIDGLFKDLSDFANRIDGRIANKRLLENLVRAGGFDSLIANRARLFFGAEMVLRHANAAAQDRSSNQVNLFAVDGMDAGPRVDLPDRPDWPPMEKLREEFSALGFYLSAHPLDSYGATLERLGVASSERIVSTLRGASGSARLKLAGIVVGKRLMTSARGNKFAFVQLTDRNGVFEVTVFSEVLAISRDLLEPGIPLLIKADGKLEGGESYRLTTSKIEPLDDAVTHLTDGVKTFLNDLTAVEPLANLVSRQPGGRGVFKLVVRTEEQNVINIDCGKKIRITPEFRSAVKSMPGVLDVRDI